jgi:hypothetical protein
MAFLQERDHLGRLLDSSCARLLLKARKVEIQLKAENEETTHTLLDSGVVYKRQIDSRVITGDPPSRQLSSMRKQSLQLTYLDSIIQ